MTMNVEPNRSFDLRAYLSIRRARIDATLESYLAFEEPRALYEAMRYSLLAGGKRLRPILCLAACELAGARAEIALPTACAIEMIHTMSLIHDDLPAMDDGDYRRGRLTNHKMYGEALAILAGDSLLAHSFELIARRTVGVPAQRTLAVIAELGRAAGPRGLAGGQVEDLAHEGKYGVGVDVLEDIHTRKTGALLEAAVLSGAILGGADALTTARLRRYAQRLGLAFQIVDDILDLTSTCEAIGKSVGKDASARKATYPSVLGLAESRRHVELLIEHAMSDLACFGDRATPLVALAASLAQSL
ncbi:polyprenyl synthetase family protein [Polyangium sorediatum]|uniref:Polyprenyl synthetase family protein n=1 Tax=Polyangium sorediatum TaxID=889274 RepID=A0ABT6NJV8_9BACT|nr:farnesyl diphosphate synthase [Polyangium sorediatum]MDI1428598.1 polyprenyl synthetase family protein [Polyangium sorediatum]